MKPSAVYTANYGTDVHLSGDPKRETLSRGVPIAKAMSEHSLLVWAMNGKPLENIHGGPLRLLHPGWPGSTSHKWLSKITLRDKVHDGQGMLGASYRVAIKPMMPGGKADDSNFRILESMPVRSIITNPQNGTRLAAGTRELRLRGAAWAGELEVRRVDVSTDFGATWRQAQLAPPKNRYDWRRWTATLRFPSDGYYEIWARATDTAGTSPAARRRQLEPARLRRQPDAPHRRAGRVREVAVELAQPPPPPRGGRAMRPLFSAAIATMASRTRAALSRWTHRVGVARVRAGLITPTRNAIGLSLPVASEASIAIGSLSPWRSILPPQGGGKSRRASHALLRCRLRPRSSSCLYSTPTPRPGARGRRRNRRSSIRQVRHRDDTFYFCTACHGFKIVAQQGMSRGRWDETFDVMVKRHGMVEVQGEQREQMLDYLAKAFPERRAPGGWKNPFER